MAQGANELYIGSKDRITLCTPKGNMAGFRWQDGALVHASGKVMRFDAEVTAEIEAAIQQATSGHLELLEAWEKEAPAASEGWTFEKVLNDTSDANGDRWCQYSRWTPGQAVSVNFSKENLLA